MKKCSLLMPLLLIVTLFGAVTPVAASTPADITIVAIMNPQPEDPTAPYSGTFAAYGSAVDGVLCSSGTIQDIANPAAGWQSNRVIILKVHKHFMCDDGVRSFEMDMQVLIAPKGTTARWIITNSDGFDGHLFGAGGLTATLLSENELQDTYFGNVHIE